MNDQRYFAYAVADDLESERLGLLEQALDPITIRHLEALPVTPGWTCLEVGAGRGSTARWLAERVSRTGRVVAIDIRTSLFDSGTASNLEIRQHDIMRDEIEGEQYDLVHCRGLLMHLSDPGAALTRMASALRPGGWLLVEDADWGSFAAVDLKDPSSDLLDHVNRIACEALLRRGTTDAYFGRRVRSMVDGLGLRDVGCDGVTPVGRGGEPIARLQVMTAQAAMSPLVTAGLLAQDQLDTMMRLFQDPSFYFVSQTLFSAWGRRHVIDK